MDTMEATKLVGGVAGSLLAFMLIGTFADALYDSSSDVVGYSIAVETAAPDDAAPEEEVDVPALVAEADAGAGASVFRRCAACHNVASSNAVGPYLNGVLHRDIASVAGFNFSGALAALEGEWDEEKLYRFLQNPRGYAPGTTMAFAGLPNSRDRANLIAYLISLGD